MHLILVLCFLAFIGINRGSMFASRQCLPGWQGRTGDNNCYLFKTIPKSWDEALTYCENMKASLVVIQSQDKKIWISSAIHRLKEFEMLSSWWVGASRPPGKQSGWIWTDGSPLLASLWITGCPQLEATSGLTNKLCGEYKLTSGEGLTDKVCDTQRPFVCQRSRDAPSFCDSENGWIERKGTCYKFVDSKRSWSDARLDCENKGAILTTPLTTMTQQTLTDMAADHKAEVWIGLHSKIRLGTQDTVAWKWADESVFGNAFWAPHQPTVLGTQKNDSCVTIQPGDDTAASWTVRWCQGERNYICQKPEGSCAPGWKSFGVRCFQFNIQYFLTWDDASNFCRNQGTKLLQITNQQIQNFVNSYLDQFRTANIEEIWIGLNDVSGTGDFTWSDNATPVLYKHFVDSSPVPNGARTCQYISTGGRDGKWMSGPCLSVRPFLCQTESNKLVLAITTPSPRYVCPRDWIQTNGQSDHCFSFYDVAMTWSEARHSCQSMNGDLARIMNQDELSLINEHLTSTKWIGLNDNQTDGKLVWLDDTEQPDYFYLSSPSRNNPSLNCVYSNGVRGSNLGRWVITACYEKHGYICQKMALNALPVTMAPSTSSAPWTAGCGPGWEEHSGSCYMFRDEQRNWAGALSVCNINGGNLASITNAVEQSFVTGRVRSLASTFYWIGVQDLSSEGIWTWVDTKPMTFRNWDAGQPDNSGESDCGAIRSPRGTWDDLRCNAENGFICKKKTTAMSTSGISTTVNSLTANTTMRLGCQSGWTAFSNYCYMIKQSGVSWSEAQSSCQRQSANLVSVRDDTEQLFIFSQAQSVVGPLWIGLNSLRSSRQFEWSDRQTVTYIRWGKDEPDNLIGGSNNCVTFNNIGQGYWSDEDCNLPTVSGYICKKAQSAVVPGTPDYEMGCSDGWVGYEAKCYHFAETPLTFNDAEGICKKSFGHLAMINDRYVQAFLSTELSTRAGVYWIGLQSYHSSSTYYYWNDGTGVRFTNWGRSHTGRETHSCALIQADRPVGLWLNSPCTEKIPFICEMKRILPSTTRVTLPSTIPTAKCPRSYKEFKGDCYRIYSTRTQYTWRESIERCRREGSSLLSIHNSTQAKWILDTITRYYQRVYWLGLNIIDQSKGYHWLDNSPFDFTQWESGQPDNHNNQEECAEWDTKGNFWRDTNCNVHRNVICQHKKGTVQPSPTSPAVTVAPIVTCPHSSLWRYFNGSCYYLHSYRDKMNWFDARDYCQKTIGGELISISSQEENNFILEWVSLHTVLTWTGLNELELNGDKWSDGSPLVYTNWAIHEPNDDFGGQKCVAIHQDNGFWHDGNCAEKFSFICKQVNGTKSTPTVTPAPQVKGYCALGWSGLGSKCYKVFGGMNASAEQVNWTSAAAACQGMGHTYDLVSITDTMEQLLVTNLLYGQNGSFWIGLNALRGYRMFQWTDNYPVGFTSWDKGEPDNNYLFHAERQQHCVEMRTTSVGQWADNYCRLTQGYICQTLKDVNLPEPVKNPSWCKAGYSVFGSSCYLVKMTNQSWKEALKSCQAEGANLASFNDQYESYYVRILTYGMTDTFWIGLSDRQLKGIYRWSDGWPVVYTNWGSGEPSRSEGEGCVGLKPDGTWTDTACNNSFRPICEFKTGTPPPYTTPFPGYCLNPAWIAFDGRCYQVHSDPIPWPQAQFTCRLSGMRLATVHSQNENDYLKHLISEKHLRYYDIWLGLVNAFKAGFKWNDGSPVDYTNWDRNEPSSGRDHSGEECVEMRRGNGLWNDIKCTTKKYYICVTEMTTPTQSAIFSRGDSGTTGSTNQATSSVHTSTTQHMLTSDRETMTSEATTMTSTTIRTKVSSATTRPKNTDTNPITRTVKPATAQSPSTVSRVTVHPRSSPHPETPSSSPAAIKDHGQNNKGKPGLGTGAVTGISLGVVILVFGTIVALVIVRKRGSFNVSGQKQSLMFENSLYNPRSDSINNSR